MTLHRAGALLLLLGAGACSSDAGRAADSSGAAADTVATDSAASALASLATACATSRAPAHPDPAALLREYVQRDAAGEFLRRSDWFEGAVLCPAREADGSSTFGVIAELTVESVSVADTAAALLARSRRVGFVSGAGTNRASFDASPGGVLSIVRARRTPWGWRIVSPAPRGLVLYSAFPVRDALGASAYTLVEQLARSSPAR